jgi:hypothetical protein
MVSGCGGAGMLGGGYVYHQHQKLQHTGVFGQVRNAEYTRNGSRDEEYTEVVNLKDAFETCLEKWEKLAPEMKQINGRVFNPLIACKFLVDDGMSPANAMAMGYLVGYGGGPSGNLNAWGGQPNYAPGPGIGGDKVVSVAGDSGTIEKVVKYPEIAKYGADIKAIKEALKLIGEDLDGLDDRIKKLEEKKTKKKKPKKGGDDAATEAPPTTAPAATP